MKSRVVIGFILGVSFLSQARAADRPTSHPNLYVNLYLQRVFEAEAMVEKSIAELELQRAKLEMAEKLRVSKAMSEEEYKERLAAVGVAAAQLNQMRAFLGESDSLYRLSIVLTEAGKEMPICLH